LNCHDIVNLRLALSGDIHPNPGPTNSSHYDSDSSRFSVISSVDSSLIRSNFSVVQYNVQSLLPKIDTIGIELKDFDILAFSETWLHADTLSDELYIQSYHLPLRKDRDDGFGGVAVYIKDNINFKRRSDLEIIDIECIWVELSILKKTVLLGVFYRPPSSPSNYFNLIEDSVNLAYDSGIHDIIITGDFNLNTQQQSCLRKINSLCDSYGLTQIIDEPTHFTEHSSSILDLFFVKNITNVVLSGVGDPFLEQDKRYHCPIYCIFMYKKLKIKSFNRKVWLYEKGNYDLLRHTASNTDWTELSDNDTDNFSLKITNQIKTLTDQCIPSRHITIKPSEPPWITSRIKNNIRKRKRLYKKAKATNNPTHWSKFKKIRNDTVSLIRRAKLAYFDNLSAKLRSDNLCSRNWWSTLKTFISPSTKSSIPTLHYENRIASDDHDKANILNDFFTNQTMLNETDANLPSLPINHSRLSSLVFNVDEVKLILGCLPLGKASGPDDINNRILRELAHELSAPLTSLFNKSIAAGHFPASWKDANVSAIFKKGDPSLVNNYRPISLLSNIEKVLERLVFKHVYNFFLENNFLSPFQSGFIPGDSPVNQLTFIYNYFCKALDEGKEIRAVFFDISKAFDRVWHKGLLAKLESAGICGNLLAWFSSYLTNRRQRVLLPGVASSWKYIKAGVPQGSILGPLLFLVFINDIVSEIRCNIRLFADDTSLYITVDHPDNTAQILNSDIVKIMNWADTWLVTFNPTKTESLIISRKQIKPIHPPISMLNTNISSVASHKHLGVILSSDCGWKSHTDYIRQKAWKRINIMRKLKFILDRKSLEIIYTTFIRPVLEYADVVWDNCTHGDKLELDKIQDEAARIVTGSSKLVSLNNLYKETGWESLETRRNNHKLALFYKMYHGYAPPYLSSLVPSLVGDESSYPLRNADNVRNISCRTKLFSESFLPSTISLWNSLPHETRNCRTISSFKHAISNRNLNKPPPYYSFGSRIDQIYHTRLRTNCSPLHLTLFQKNLIDSPRCQCGEIESTEHYLLICPRYNLQRASLFHSVNPILRVSTKLLLYGSDVLSHDNNIKVFSAVQTYIHQTKRFY
jgi:hypothetical protein